jgi:hypothetical protein
VAAGSKERALQSSGSLVTALLQPSQAPQGYYRHGPPITQPSAGLDQYVKFDKGCTPTSIAKLLRGVATRPHAYADVTFYNRASRAAVTETLWEVSMDDARQAISLTRRVVALCSSGAIVYPGVAPIQFKQVPYEFPTLADESVAYRMTITGRGAPTDQYKVVFRRHNVIGTVSVGAPRTYRRTQKDFQSAALTAARNLR